VEIKTSIIGLGRIASLLEDDTKREKPCTHAGAIAANPDCVLSGGCDLDEERQRLFAERWGAPIYADAAEMIRAQNPDLLIIATHPDSHYHYCRLAAAHGVPVIICEKPLADTLSAARRIASLVRGSGTGDRGLGVLKQNSFTIIINHERRYSADYVKAREILAAEKLGSLLSVRAVLYMGKNNRLLDVFWHDGTHLADAVMFLTGRVLKHRKRWGAKLSSSSGTAWLEGELRRTTTEDTEEHGGKEEFHIKNSVELRGKKIPVIIEVGAGRDHLVFEIEFSCANGRLRIGNGLFEVWESDESPYAEQFRSLKKTEAGFEGPTGYFANMLADAVSCVRQPGRKPASSATDGLAVIEYLHSVKAWR